MRTTVSRIANPPSCDGGCDSVRSSTECLNTGNPLPASVRRGRLPVVLPTCPGDSVPEPGRINVIWVPRSTFWEVFNRAATYSPINPRKDSDTKGAGPLAMSLAVDATNRAIFPGFIVDASTSNNVAPGDSQLDVVGVFEDSSAWTQSIVINSSRPGQSRFVVMATSEAQGGAYPRLFQLSNAFVITSLGLLAPDASLAVTVSIGNQGTTFTIQSLTPVSYYWDQVLAAWDGQFLP